MRNPKRIQPILEKLDKAWRIVPDWRMGQLVSNLIGAGRQDVFNIEDDEWEELLDAFLEKYGRPGDS